VLLNADQVSFAPDAGALRKAARTIRQQRSGSTRLPAKASAENWAEWWTAIAQEPELRAELELRALRFPHEHMGTPTPDLEGHRTRLRRAGFRETEVVWSLGESRILAAVR
jgi:hypothetical protein